MPMIETGIKRILLLRVAVRLHTSHGGLDAAFKIEEYLAIVRILALAGRPVGRVCTRVRG